MAAMMLVTAGCSGKKADPADGTQTESSEAAGTAEPETEEYVAEGSIKLGEYKNIPVTVMKAEVTDEEVESQIQQILNSRSQYEELDGKEEAQLGDQVNIDYKGMKDGEAFEGGTAEGYDLTLGSGQFIEGFEDGLVGVKKGEQRSLNLTFPDPYPNNPDLAGQPVVFEVTVNAVKRKVVPELTDEFAVSINQNTATVEEFRTYVHDEMLKQSQMSIDNQRNSDILNAITANSEIVCSTDEIDKAYDSQLQAYTDMVASYGLDLATYAGFMGLDEAGLKTEIRAQAKEIAKQEKVIKEIASVENITADASDQLKLIQEYGYESLDTFMATTGLDAETLAETTLIQKVMDFLVEQADITVSEAPAAEGSATAAAEDGTEAAEDGAKAAENGTEAAEDGTEAAGDGAKAK